MRKSGSVVRKGDNKYLLRVYIGTDEEGKRQYTSKTVYGTISQARQELTRMTRDRDTRTIVKTDKVTVREWLDLWLESKKVAPQTLKNYETTLKTYVHDHPLARMRLQDVERKHVQALYNAMESARLSSRTIQYVHALLHQAFKLAVRDRKLHINPTDHTERKKREKIVKPQVLTLPEVTKLLAATQNTPLHAMWTLILATGMRPQEVLPLKWSDINGSSIHIQRVVAVIGGKQVVQEGRAKTEKSVRTVDIGATVQHALKEHRRAQLEARLACSEWQDNDYVFAGRQGRLKDLQAIRRNWSAALKLAGLPDRRLYDTRHSHITHLIQSGTPAPVVAARVGNSAAITLSTYTHILAETQAALADKTEEILFPQPKIAKAN